jgi:hypothetical protein
MEIEDWSVLESFFPERWQELAAETGALKGLHQDKDISTGDYIRTLVIHLGCGYSLKETAVRSKHAGLADLSHVGVFKRLKKAKEWLRAMCLLLFKEQGVNLDNQGNFQLRLFDATTVKEPGKTGSLWRIHYSVRIPSLTCDFFRLSETKGKGTGESFFQFPIKKEDYVVADRGYSTASGVHFVASKKAYVMVRVNTQSLPILNLKGAEFPLLKNVTSIKKAGTIRSWQVLIPNRSGECIKGRICVIRKTKKAIEIAHEKLRKSSNKKGHKTKPETVEYAKYVIIFTTFPEESFSSFDVLQWYRTRWQVELIFKKFKSIAQLGHLPKQDPDSSQAWLYGKLFVALLIEKLIAHANSISPWGYGLAEYASSERLA